MIDEVYNVTDQRILTSFPFNDEILRFIDDSK